MEHYTFVRISKPYQGSSQLQLAWEGADAGIGFLSDDRNRGRSLGNQKSHGISGLWAGRGSSDWRRGFTGFWWWAGNQNWHGKLAGLLAIGGDPSWLWLEAQQNEHTDPSGSSGLSSKPGSRSLGYGW